MVSVLSHFLNFPNWQSQSAEIFNGSGSCTESKNRLLN